MPKKAEYLDRNIQGLYVFNGGMKVAVSTVNISFQDELLKEIDLVAKNEARSRSELIREAARFYIQRKQKWDQIFKIGNSIGRDLSITEDELNGEIKKARKLTK